MKNPLGGIGDVARRGQRQQPQVEGPNGPSVERDFTLRGVSAVAPRAPTPLPRLMRDWNQAVCEAVAEDRALDELKPQLAEVVRRAQEQVEEPFTKAEQQRIKIDFLRRQRPDVVQRHLSTIIDTPAHAQQTVENCVRDMRAPVSGRKDPFTPIALGDPQARSREWVLFEDPDLMVLVDSFSPTPKALVVPKATTMFPTDLSPAMLEKISRVAAATADAFSAATGAASNGIWINPPQYLMVRQLHVHVMPDLKGWEQMARRLEPEEVAAKEQAIFSAVETNLPALIAQRLAAT